MSCLRGLAVIGYSVNKPKRRLLRCLRIRRQERQTENAGRGWHCEQLNSTQVHL